MNVNKIVIVVGFDFIAHESVDDDIAEIKFNSEPVSLAIFADGERCSAAAEWIKDNVPWDS